MSRNLLPTNFIDRDGKLVTQGKQLKKTCYIKYMMDLLYSFSRILDVAVPCLVPASCQKCSQTGTYSLQPGSEKIAVVTEKGINSHFPGGLWFNHGFIF